MAKDEGTYESYKGSPISKGEFQHNLWGIKEIKIKDDDGNYISHTMYIIPRNVFKINSIYSGNYLLSVFDANQNLVFTTRFVVYEQQANKWRTR
jgi:hypothetical protein